MRAQQTHARRARKQGRARLGSVIPWAFIAHTLVLFPKIRHTVVRRRQRKGRVHKPADVYFEPSWVLQDVPIIAGTPIPRARLTLRGTPQDMRKRDARRHGLPTIGRFFKTSVAGVVTSSPVRFRVTTAVVWHRYPVQGRSSLQHSITVLVSPDGLVPGRLGGRQRRRVRRESRRVAQYLNHSIALTGLTPPFVIPARLTLRTVGKRRRHQHRRGEQSSGFLNTAIGHTGDGLPFVLSSFFVIRSTPPPDRRGRSRKHRGGPVFLLGAISHSGSSPAAQYDFHHYYA